MDFTWGDLKTYGGQDAYLDWFDHVYQPGTSGAFGYEIILVRIKASGQQPTVERTLIWLKNQVDGATAASDFLMDDVECQLLETLIRNPPDADNAPELFLHRKRDDAGFAQKYRTKFDLLPNGAGRPNLARPLRPVVDVPPAPIVAVIDDAIGYLNARFTDGKGVVPKTRLHRVWLQSEDRVAADGAHLSMRNGKQISGADIDALLAQGAKLDEAAQYAAINEELYGHEISPVWHGITAGAGSELAVTHGTLVSDIAGGAEPAIGNDPLRDCPMLAVQLPPQAVEDTSGSKLQPYVVRALRWIIAQADNMCVDGVARPLIVNVSLGVLAGAKDGTSLIERQIAAEVLRREARTAMPMRVVFAFGNDNLTRQIGYMTLEPNVAQNVTLRVQPEDYTPSFVELRSSTPDDLMIMIENLLSAPMSLGVIPAGQSISLSRDGKPDVARIYAIAASPLDGGGQTAAYYVLAIAPTATFEGGKPLAPCGVWRITLQTEGPAQSVRIGVQRDDRPIGFQALARQSYLDDAALWQWKQPEKRAFTPPADGPVTARGSHSAWLSADMPEQIYSVGVALGDTGFAAPYTATGAPYTRPTPSVSAIGDSSWTLRGVMASGTLSGTTAAMSGTSVAAPQITRELALLFAGGPDIGPWNPAEENAAREVQALATLEWSFVPSYQVDQLGPLNVSREAGLRPRF
jgi:hypothetical protein